MLSFYQELFSSIGAPSQPLHTVTSYPPIADDDLLCLAEPVSIDEVQSALFSMGNYKALEPGRLPSCVF